MSLFASTLVEELPLLKRERVRLQYLGDMSELPDETRATFEYGLAQTAGHEGMVLAVAVNYGSRSEIVRAARRLARRCASGELRPGRDRRRAASSASCGPTRCPTRRC